MLTTLLDKRNAPLNRLALHRMQLDASSPIVELVTAQRECLLYGLVGQYSISIDGQRLGVFQGRRTVTERRIQAIRLPNMNTATVHIAVEGHAADVLYIECMPTQDSAPHVGNGPYVHHNDATWHDVGTGSYRRTVAEVPTPPGYEIHCGETLSDGAEGVWSSWPSHCAPEEMGRYAEHEEVFFCLTSGYFLMREDGRYCTGDPAKGVREIQNGQALVTPLGSHEIVVSPGNVGAYCWFYLSFLKKTYNKWATEQISRVYVK